MLFMLCPALYIIYMIGMKMAPVNISYQVHFVNLLFQLVLEPAIGDVENVFSGIGGIYNWGKWEGLKICRPCMKEVVARDGIVAIVIIRRVGGRHLRTIISMLTRKLSLNDDLRWGLAEGEPWWWLEEGFTPSDAVCDQEQLVFVLLNVLVLLQENILTLMLLLLMERSTLLRISRNPSLRELFRLEARRFAA